MLTFNTFIVDYRLLKRDKKNKPTDMGMRH